MSVRKVSGNQTYYKPKSISIEDSKPRSDYINKIFCYMRYSTASQDQQAQEPCVMAKAKQIEQKQYAKYNHKPEIIKVIQQQSGMNIRPKLDQIINKLEEGNCFIVFKIDRIGRKATDIISKVDQICKKRVRFISLKDIPEQEIDTGTIMGTFFVALFALFSQIDYYAIKTRTTHGGNIKLGRKPGISPKNTDIAKEAMHLYTLKEDGHYKYSLKQILTKCGKEVYNSNGIKYVKPLNKRTFYLWLSYFAIPLRVER